MIRLRRSGRIAPTQNRASADAEVVLPPLRVHERARKVRHQVVCLKKPPGQVLQENHVNAAARGQREARLRLIPGHLRTGMRGAEHHLSKRHKVIEVTEVHSRTK